MPTLYERASALAEGLNAEEEVGEWLREPLEGLLRLMQDAGSAPADELPALIDALDSGLAENLVWLTGRLCYPELVTMAHLAEATLMHAAILGGDFVAVLRTAGAFDLFMRSIISPDPKLRDLGTRGLLPMLQLPDLLEEMINTGGAQCDVLQAILSSAVVDESTELAAAAAESVLALVYEGDEAFEDSEYSSNAGNTPRGGPDTPLAAGPQSAEPAQAKLAADARAAALEAHPRPSDGDADERKSKLTRLGSKAAPAGAPVTDTAAAPPSDAQAANSESPRTPRSAAQRSCGTGMAAEAAAAAALLSPVLEESGAGAGLNGTPADTAAQARSQAHEPPVRSPPAPLSAGQTPTKRKKSLMAALSTPQQPRPHFDKRGPLPESGEARTNAAAARIQRLARGRHARQYVRSELPRLQAHRELVLRMILLRQLTDISWRVGPRSIRDERRSAVQVCAARGMAALRQRGVG